MNSNKQVELLKEIEKRLDYMGASFEKKSRVVFPINDKDAYLVDFSSKVPDGVRICYVLDLDETHSYRREKLQKELEDEKKYLEKMFNTHVSKKRYEPYKEGDMSWLYIGHHHRMGFFQFIRFHGFEEITIDKCVSLIVPKVINFVETVNRYLSKKEDGDQGKPSSNTNTLEENNNSNEVSVTNKYIPTSKEYREVELTINSIAENGKLTKTEKEQLIKSRVGQIFFKKALLNVEKKCRLCGVSDERFLIASHIKPWSKSDDAERLDVNNGLLLCPNHDALFDKGYISFDNNGTILISDSLDEMTKVFLNINETMNFNISKEQQNYMKWHREKCFKN